MYRIAFVFNVVFMSLGVFADHPTTCPPGYTRFGSYCYLHIPEALTFFEAVTACDVADGRVVEVTSAEEQEMVGKFLSTLNLDATIDVWLGATDFQEEGHWIYDSSHNKEAIANYNNWAPASPQTNRLNNCASMNLPNGWRWVDTSCTYHWTVLCYVQLADVASPAN